MRARFDCRRLLVLCPKGLSRKWQDELDYRFGVQARIADAAELVEELRRARGSDRAFALICSMQGLRLRRSRDPHSEERSQSPQQRLAQLRDEAARDDPLVDLLVIDEAHHLRNPKTHLYHLGKSLAAVSAHRLLLSATPIHLGSRDLHTLLTLVDEGTFRAPGVVDDLVRLNAPLVRARDRLLDPGCDVPEILEALDEARRHVFLRDSAVLAAVREAVLGSERLDNARRARLAERLERANRLSNYINRTRRRDVEERRPVRDVRIACLEMDEPEREFYNVVQKIIGLRLQDGCR